MDLQKTNNFYHLCRIPHPHFASYHELEGLSAKKQNNPDQQAMDAGSDVNDPTFPIDPLH